MSYPRAILLPGLGSAVVMFALSYLWHGVVLSDLQEVGIPKALYLVLSGIVYLVIGFGITFLVHKAIQYEFISLKGAFPLMSMAIGSAVGFFVFLVIFVVGMSFTRPGVVHIVADILWQMAEQGVGGLVVSLGIIYDMHQRFLEQERGS